MSATLGDIRTIQDEILANTKTGNYGETERTRAINQAFRQIWRYPASGWPQLVTSATVSFTDGAGSLPADFFSDLMLYEQGTGSEIKTEYNKASTISFQEDVSETYTLKEGGIYIYDEDTIDLKLWYVKKPFTTDLSDDDDSTGMDTEFDEPAAIISAARLIRSKNKQNKDATFLLYGQGGTITKPEPFSAFGTLSELYLYYKKLYTAKNSRTLSTYNKYKFFQ